MVRQRAGEKCEYCKIPDLGFGFPFHIDHVRAVKHGGRTLPGNLASCCPDCNFYKGTDFGTYLGNRVVLFFNPRIDRWEEHFQLENGTTQPLTETGAATVQIFQFNLPARVVYRRELALAGL